jgi:hypothetical protein
MLDLSQLKPQYVTNEVGEKKPYYASCKQSNN